MEDKILDDDIIDLTDLLEEGQPPGDKEESGDQGDAAASMNEPDSFDLGKEISMEYDVSVEEIESGGESLDIDAALSSNEEEALTQNKTGDEDIITLEDTGERLGADLAEDSSAFAEETDLSSNEQHVLSPDVPDEAQSLSKKEFAGEVEFDAPEPGPAAAQTPADETDVFELEAPTVVADEASAEGLIEESPGISGLEEESASPDEEIIPQVSTGEVLEEIRQEIPGMIEGVVRPFIAELVKEIIAGTRDQLPGIVEKVIREEIDKLKKLDS